LRLFVALEIPAAVRNNLAALLGELRKADADALKHRARWVRPENLHVTLKFIGHLDGAKADSIRAMLGQVRSDSPVTIEFRGLGFFPGEKRPHVLWVGTITSPNLPGLADDIDKRLEPLGVPRETRAFRPHLTLARFDPPGISEKVRAEVQRNLNLELGALRTGEFHLFESKTKPSGAEYTILQSFQFAPES
jgi:RNA 2',3'-cyclic 3'-phosphodiesterase